MATQFFEQQDKARSNTIRLVTLFMLAVLGLVLINSTLAYFAIDWANNRSVNKGTATPDIPPYSLAIVVGIGTLAIIAIGTLYQTTVLRWGGGSGVAESLGGRQLLGDTRDLNERKVLNIVEEMAIASGIPVPPIYLLEEPAINAFAAGYTPGDAVVGVTRGAVENLTREELQGVIAHEFSHILNGDMRINIRMIGVLHGILLLGLIGQMIVRSMRYVDLSRSSKSDNKGNAAAIILLVGIVLIVLGSIGSFIGGLIKAAISRQREYLADASAVQFTRNPPGLAGALKRIAAIATHGRLAHPNAAVASHMYFAQGISEGLTGLMATHPPLDHRIRALEPNWDGTLPILKSGFNSNKRYTSASKGTQTAPSGVQAGQTSNFSDSENQYRTSSPTPPPHHLQKTSENEGIPVRDVLDASDQIGAPELAHRQYVASLLQNIAPEIIEAARDPYTARVLVMTLLISNEPDVRDRQLEQVEMATNDHTSEWIRKLSFQVQDIPDAARLPLVDLSLPMLRRMSMTQYREFADAFNRLCIADDHISIFEWTLAQVIRRNLRKQYTPKEVPATRYYRLNGLQDEMSLLFSVLAKQGNEDGRVARAFQFAAERFPSIPLSYIETDEASLGPLEKALQKLSLAHPRRRGDVVDACAAIVCSDGFVRVREAELLRGISDLLECPMPPLVGKMEANDDQ